MSKAARVTITLSIPQAQAIARMVNERLASSPQDWQEAVGCSLREANNMWRSASTGIARIEAAMILAGGSGGR